MSAYSLVLFVHVLGALGLFVTTGIGQLVLARLRRARTVAQAREWLEVAQGVAKVEPLVALVLLGAGLYLTATAWGWRVAWIDVALGGLLAVVVIGSAVGGPRVAARTRAAAEAPDGPVPAELRARLDDPVLWTLARATAALELGIVFLMVVKPGLLGSLTALGVALALGLASAAPRWRSTKAISPATSVPARG